MHSKRTLAFCFLILALTMVGCDEKIQSPTSPTPDPPTTPTTPPTATILCNGQKDSCSIAYGVSVTISWSGSLSCSVTGTTWTGTSGSQSSGPLMASRDYELKCIGANNQTATSVVKVVVASQLPPSAFNFNGSCTTVNDSSQRANLTWTTSTGATSYAVERRVWSVGVWTRQVTVTTTVYSETVSNSEDYYWRIVAINSAGEKMSNPTELQVCSSVVPPPPVIPGGPGVPTIEFTFVPPIGTFGNLRGIVKHVLPSEHRVACFIYVLGRWWPKPTYDNQLTSIRPDGSWECDITTGGTDEQASKIAAFLVRGNYPPTSAPPTGSHVLAEVTVNR